LRSPKVRQPSLAFQQLPDNVGNLAEEYIQQVVPSIPIQPLELRQALEMMVRSSNELSNLIPWINSLLQWPEKQRRLLSHFGAIGQVGDNWGVDPGNVVYSILWKYFCESNVAQKLSQFHNITSQNGSVGDDISWKPSSSF